MQRRDVRNDNLKLGLARFLLSLEPSLRQASTLLPA
jgi:hypothetical protein